MCGTTTRQDFSTAFGGKPHRSKNVLTDDRWIGVPIIPTLLFIGTDNFPRRQKHPLQFDDVYVLWGKALGKLVRQLRTT